MGGEAAPRCEAFNSFLAHGPVFFAQEDGYFRTVAGADRQLKATHNVTKK